MSEVACVFGPVLEEVRARGVAPETFIEGIGFDADHLCDPRQRIPWEAFTELAQRASAILGPDGLADVAARSAVRSVPSLVRRVLHHFGDARPIYRIGARWWGPRIFRTTRATCEVLEDGRVREVIEILPEYRESPEFFRGVQALLRVMPLLFGLPEATVELRQDGRRGEFLIAPPPGRRPVIRSRRKRGTAVLDEKLREHARRSRASAARPAEQLRLLEDLGLRLAQVHDVCGLVRTVASLLEEHLDVHGVRLSRAGGGGAEHATSLLAEAGDVAGPSTSRLPLRTGGRAVGELELWGEQGNEEERVAALAPWIALALANLPAPGLSSPADLAAHLHELGPEVAARVDSETLLLLEDDELLRMVVGSLFEDAGFQVLEHRADPTEVPDDDAEAALLVADWSRSLDPAFLSGIERLRPHLRGILLLPLREL